MLLGASLVMLLAGCPKPAGSASGSVADAPDASDAPLASDAGGERDAMLRVYLQIDPARVTREQLTALGVEVDTVAGDVVTARVPAGALERVRAADGVRHVEMARGIRLRGADQPNDAGKRD